MNQDLAAVPSTLSLKPADISSSVIMTLRSLGIVTGRRISMHHGGIG